MMNIYKDSDLKVNKNDLVKWKDPRVTKTVVAIGDSLLELLRTKSFDKISVKNICEKAAINRSTFYAHFEDKYHLLNIALSHMISMVSNELIESGKKYDLAVQIFEIVKKYKFLFEEILIKNDQNELKNIFQNVISQDLKHKANEIWSVTKSEVEMNVYSEFYSGAIVSSITWWLKNNMKITEKEMGKYFDDLLSKHWRQEQL
ncbi:TetR/AcrR family transcriptional regulator [Clostridium sp. SHJSY1]|uniref:TetR/AcrR family transcriptional regulator n=1 Tax=Clostridium sp. SHJSY1 TaxID=2942483 RepID=UPI0028743D96|nr:TetR/AcrR family transcriptional regulator [Clostridium sp. SHJSY1]MDS0526698.1 TetR/AcrR family transcriptional regulator [Clostridium sp. SHJSY1]